MNGKVSLPYGNDLPGLLDYLFGPGRSDEHRDPHLVACAEHVNLEGEPRLAEAGQLHAAKLELDAPRTLLTRSLVGDYVWHCSLSLPPDDRRLSDAEWGQIAREIVRRLGFDDPSSGKAPCRWIAVHHGLSAGGNDHIHVVVNLVREDETRASTFRDWTKLSRACADLERAYGLQVVDGRPGAGLPGLTRAELERAQREGRDEPDRLRLARLVRACATTAGGEAEFARRLQQAGALVHAHRLDGRTVGYAVALPRPGEGPPVWYRGSSLAADLALPRLRQRWELSMGVPTPSVRAGTERGSLPETVTYHGRTWEQAAQVVASVRQRLGAVPPDDVDAWAAVARDTAGLLSAWSERLEKRSGPLARAANILAYSAQTRRGTPRSPRRSAVLDLRGVAVVIAQASTQGQGAVGQVLLLRQITRLMEAIHDAHIARGQARQARLLAEVAHHQLATLHHRPQHSSPSTVGVRQPRSAAPTAEPVPRRQSGADERSVISR
ncbi:relaxase/mobilization nuclease domain-containing protein [Nonomuraea sp. NPDC003707]